MTESRMMELLSEELGRRGYDAQLLEVAKNNKVMPAVCVRVDNTGVNFYPDTFGNKDAAISCLADEVENHLEDMIGGAPDTDSLSDPAYVLSNLEIRICKEEWNEVRLKGAVTRRLYGTDLILYLMLTVELPSGGKGSCIVKEDYLKILGISEDTAWDNANRNAEYRVSDLCEIMMGMMGTSFKMPGTPDMAVISNKETAYGAAAIANPEALREASELLNSRNLYIIPSSIHECIAVPAEFGSPDEIRNMINDVNAGVVSETERLSDHPYKWDGETMISVGTIPTWEAS